MTETKDGRTRVREHRERLREQGLRPVQVWVPDVNSPVFREQAHLQSLAVSGDAAAVDDQAFVDAISEFNEAR